MLARRYSILMVIYKTINLINNKFYIGKDSRNNPDYLGSGLLLQNAINKYGKENFKKEILQCCNTLKELADAEIYWINKLNALNKNIAYNIAEGGSGGNLGREVNKRISLGVKNYRRKESAKNKQKRKDSFSETINSRTPEEKQLLFKKMSTVKKGQIPWNKGKCLEQPSKLLNIPKSKEHREKMALARNREIATPFGIYVNAKACADEIGVDMSTVHRRCKSKTVKFKDWYYTN